MKQLLLIFLLGLQAGPSNEEQLMRLKRAVELQQRGEFQEAEAEYRSFLAHAPRHAEARANLGAVLMRLGRYEEAVAAYDTALELAPGLAPVRLNLAIAHYRQGAFQKAVDGFEQFLRSSPGHLQATQLLGLSLLELGRDADAVKRLNESLLSATDDAAVLYGLGLASLRLNRPELKSITERLAAAPEGRGPAHLLRGQKFLADLEFERAVLELEAAAAIKTDLPRLHYSLGLSYFKLGRQEEALRAFETELLRTPSDPTTLFYIGYLRDALGELEGARTAAAQVLALEPGSAEANALLGKVLMKQGRASEALAPLETAVKSDPEDTERRYLLARAYQQVGRREDAAREFEEVQRRKALQLERDRARIPKYD